MTVSPRIKLGYISGVYGVRGWNKIYSFTVPRGNILDFPLWFLGSEEQTRGFTVERGRCSGGQIVAKLVAIDSREQAGQVVGQGIYVERKDLPETGKGEFYWVDLVGLRVFTEAGDFLGTVEDLMETGANDVLVVRGERERLIPFVQNRFVKSIDLENQRMVVAWDRDF